jgi:PKD repeat protein
MNKQLLLALIMLVLTTHLVSGQVVCTCADCPQMLNNFSSFYSAVNVSNSPDSLGVNGQGLCRVRLYFAHEFVGNIAAFVGTPSGQTIQLIGAPTADSGPTNGTTWAVDFVPCAATAFPDPGFPATWTNSISWGTNNSYTGSYHPANGCFENLTGPVNGEWRISMSDLQSPNIGALSDFELEFCKSANIICNSNQGSISATPSTGCTPLSVTFSAQNFPLATYTGRLWEFPGGTPAVSSDSMPTVTYTEAGNFSATLNLYSATDTVVFSVPNAVSAIGPPAAEYTPQIINGNQVYVPVTNVLSGQVEYWIIDGVQTPNLPYFLPSPPTDSVVVQLVLSNECGIDTNTQVVYIVFPNAAFEWTSSELLVEFDNQSSGATEYEWIFGDGNTSTLENPNNQYSDPGTYEVILKASNSNGLDVTSRMVTVPTVSTQGAATPPALRVSPNPAQTYVVLHTSDWAVGTPISWSLTDATGQILRGGKALAPDPKISTAGLVAGVYLLQVRTSWGQGVVRVVIF